LIRSEQIGLDLGEILPKVIRNLGKIGSKLVHNRLHLSNFNWIWSKKNLTSPKTPEIPIMAMIHHVYQDLAVSKHIIKNPTQDSYS